MLYRKKKLIDALSNGQQVRIKKSDVDYDGFVVSIDGSLLDLVNQDDDYLYYDAQGQSVDTVQVSWDAEPEKEEYDLDQLKECIENVETAVYATEPEEVDQKPIVDALEALRIAIDTQNYPEAIDYSSTLERLLQATTERFDATEITTLLQELVNKETPEFKIPDNLISDNRLKVEVDRIGAGGGGQSTQQVEDKLDTINTTLTGGSAVKAADSFSIDAFGRWRVSNPQTIFDSKQLYDNNPLFWDDQETSGTGTSSSHSVNEAATTMSVGATTAGTRVRQTFMRFNYQPGKSQRILCTFGEMDTTTGITKRTGYFDENNGIFLESEEGTVNIVRRTYVTGSAVDNEVAQASWNIDPMDGTGPSGVTLDFTKTQIFFIDFEWLGVGRVRAGFVVDGKIYYTHAFNNANNLTTVYMSTPNLPLRYEIATDGNGAADDFVHICSSVESEGGLQDNGLLHYESNAETHVDCADVGTLYAIMGGRLKSTHLSASVKLVEATVAELAGSKTYEWQLLAGATVAGTFTFSDKANSAVQVAKGAATNTVTGGTVIAGGYATSSNKGGTTGAALENAIRLGSAIDGTPQEFVFAVKPIKGTGQDIVASMTWRELL